MKGKKSQPRHGASLQNLVRRASLCVLLFIPGMAAFSEPLYSPAWGFRLDLPEGYEYTGGDGKTRFSFQHPDGAVFDLAVYSRADQTMKALVDDTIRRLGSRGDVSYFEYGDKLAALLELDLADPAAAETGAGNRGQAGKAGGRLSGWALCVELQPPDGGKSAFDTSSPPLLLALAYGPAGDAEMAVLHLSALDSIAPSGGEQRFPGPVMEFGYPRGEAGIQRLAGAPVDALIREHDAEAAQALVDREYNILRRYLFSPQWQEAWVRFYRAIYRDSWERLADAAFRLERYWNAPPAAPPEGGNPGTVPALAAGPGGENRVFAGKALAWVQSFRYERDLMGSDFVNLVSAAFEGRGDCDSRALLWAIVLAQADIPAAIMISREYSHALGLGDLEGPGARFPAGEKKLLVAETTAPVGIGLIAQDISDIESWFAVTFE
jgi:hypothetical protein